MSKSLQLSKKNSIFASFLAYNAKLRGNNQIMNNIEDSKIGTIKQWTPSEQSLACILSESHYTPSEFVDALGSLSFTALLKKIKPGALPWIKALFKAKVYSHVPKLNRRFAKECGLGLFAKRSWEIQSVTFSYNSKTVDGRDVVLSGRVTFLNNKDASIPHRVKSISLHTHQAFFDPSWTPSQNLMYVPLKVLWDSAVIEPDLQKWGITYGIESDGGGSAVTMAHQLADCAVAALEVMQQYGVSLAPDGYTTNWGSSQGSVPTVCFAKWYDTEAPQWFKDRLRLRSTYVVEGVCDVQEYMEYLYQHPELINIALVLIVGYFKAFSSEQLGGYKAGDFVPEWYNEAKYEVNGRKLSYLDAVSHYIPDILHIHSTKMTSFTEVFAPDILTADGKVDLNCPKLRAWMSCHAKHCDLNNWTPVHPVYIAHSKADEMIPFEMAYSLYRRISNNGQNPMVHMLSVPSMHYVPRGGMNPHFVLAFMGQIMMAFAENPEGMQRLYKTVK